MALSDPPPISPAREQDDALRLLRTLVGPCQGADSHSWRKCKRCAAVHGVEMRFPLSIKALETVLSLLKPAKALSLEDAIANANTGESDIQQRLRWFQEIARLRAEVQTLTAERDGLRTLAKEATNGWACYASRKIEHDEIARLHREIDALTPPVRSAKEEA